MNKVGEARQEPNINPYLPPPVGRISLTLNPWKMFVRSLKLIINIDLIGWTTVEKKDLHVLLCGSMLCFDIVDVPTGIQ